MPLHLVEPAAALLGRFLLSAGLASNQLTVYAIEGNGALNPKKQHAMGQMPNWIEFVDLR